MGKKSSILAIMLLGVICTLFSCSIGNKNDSNLKENSITKVEFTEKEKMLLSTGSDHQFAFNFNIGDKYNKLKLWIEKYKEGNLIPEDIQKSELAIEGDGMIIMTTEDIQVDTLNKRLLNITVSDNNGYSTIKTLRGVNEEKLGDMLSVMGINEIDNNEIDKEILLGALCYSRKGMIESLDEEFFKEPSKNIDKLKDYDIAYLVKCEFIKEDQ